MPLSKLTVGTVLTASLFASSSAWSHAVLNQMSTPANFYYTAQVRITHGCGEEPTHTVKVLIPEGVERITPRYKEGWTVSTKMSKRETPREAHNIIITEEVSEITWEGGSLPTDQYDEFHIRMWINGNEGDVLYFKTVQVCPSGASERWIEIPKPGENPFALEFPAPFVKLTKPLENPPF